ncbi:MAG: hypothetical protein P8Y93_10415 [Acidobacteriota bacterium]
MEETPDRPSWEPELTMPPRPEQQPQFNQLQRLWMMFASPGKVFADIAI